MTSAGSAMPSATQPRRSLHEIITRETQRSARRRLFWLGSLVLVVLLGAAGYLLLRPKPLPFVARFRLQSVSQGPITREVRATGRVEALTTVQVGAEISGRIATVEVDYNQHVQEGQVLARFDRAALDAQLAQTQASLAAAQMALEQAKTERDRGKRENERLQRLFANHAVSEADRDTVAANARLSEQRVQAAESQVAAQRAAFALARTNLAHTLIRSPIEGIVITRNIDSGQTVAAMLQSPTLFTVAADLRRMRVVAAVDEADIGDVKVQQSATFTVNAYPERTFEGVVVEVRNSPVVVQDVVTYGAVIEADNFDLALKPGMTASARIRTAHTDSALRVPNAALHFTPPRQPVRDTRGVWTLAGDELQFVSVQCGISDGELTSIEAGVLAPNARVIVDLTPEGRTLYASPR
jgi:HlyD family secretion protein